MKLRVNVSASLFTCRRCGAEHNNLIKHVCVIPFSALASRKVSKKKGR